MTQTAGAIVMHPSGKFLYAINRASGQVVHDGVRVSAGSSNSVAVFAIDVTVRDGSGVRTLPASIALFRIGDDGRPVFARSYDVETGPQKNLLWVGFVALP
ncbi:MAG: hypothetical protein ABIT20_11005 [Gemmatimonadaceae bacterium]